METTVYMPLGTIVNKMENNVTFADWLKEQLELRGWTQTQLAAKSGLTRAAISNYINQIRQPEAASLIAIADALDLPREHVLKVAGILQENNKIVMTEDIAEMIELITDWDEYDRAEMLELFRLRDKYHKARRKHKRRSAGNNEHGKEQGESEG